MSKALKLLSDLTEEELSQLAGIGPQESHITVGRDRLISIPPGLRRIAVKGDHNIETVTFDCPRYWDDNDMSAMGVYIEYELSNGYSSKYPVDNIQVDGDIMHFDWTISKNVTQAAGRVGFLVHAINTDDDGQPINEWHSEPSQDMYVSDGINGNDEEIPIDPDLTSRLLQRLNNLEQNVANLVVDDKLNSESTNPVENRVIAREIYNLANDASGVKGAINTAQAAADNAQATANIAGQLADSARNTLDRVVLPRLSTVENTVKDLDENRITVDIALDDKSDNPVRNGAVTTSLKTVRQIAESANTQANQNSSRIAELEKGGNLVVDDVLNPDSTNPVQNKVVWDEISSVGQTAANLLGELDTSIKPRLSAAETSIGNAVMFTEQELTEEQKKQARDNIGAGTGSIDVEDIYDIAVDATAEQINNTLSTASGSVLFPKGKTFVIDKGLVASDLKDVTIDLNGCTLELANSLITGRQILTLTNCDNVVIKNGTFDCKAFSSVINRSMGISSQNSVVSIKNCIFKNSNYHNIWVHNGYCDGENIDFIDLYRGEDASDVFADAEDGKRVETHWRNINSTRLRAMSRQVFYFGVYSDTQDCYHTVDGLKAYNCVQTIDLRGGEGYFRNIYAENCSALITQHVIVDSEGNTYTSEANAPIATYENVHLKNADPGNLPAPIIIWAGRRIRLKNVIVEAPTWTSSSENHVKRAIDIASNTGHPVRDVLIEDVKYTGVDLHTSMYIDGDVQCELNNVVVDAELKSAGIHFINETENTKVVIRNYETSKNTVSDVNASGKHSANINHIKMTNTYPTIGTTDERPVPFDCETHTYYDTTLGKSVFWNGTEWVDTLGAVETALDGIIALQQSLIGGDGE